MRISSVILSFLFFSSINVDMAFAKHHHSIHKHHHRYSHNNTNYNISQKYNGVGRFRIVTVPVESGQRIHVAEHLAPRFQALVHDFIRAGYHPRHIGCFARSGHVPNSRHYYGAACDFDQTGWGRTVSFMYRAHAIIQKHGFRDGCNFGDCGHVDDGFPLHHRQYRPYYRSSPAYRAYAEPYGYYYW